MGIVEAGKGGEEAKELLQRFEAAERRRDVGAKIEFGAIAEQIIKEVSRAEVRAFKMKSVQDLIEQAKVGQARPRIESDRMTRVESIDTKSIKARILLEAHNDPEAVTHLERILSDFVFDDLNRENTVFIVEGLTRIRNRQTGSLRKEASPLAVSIADRLGIDVVDTVPNLAKWSLVYRLISAGAVESPQLSQEDILGLHLFNASLQRPDALLNDVVGAIEEILPIWQKHVRVEDLYRSSMAVIDDNTLAPRLFNILQRLKINPPQLPSLQWDAINQIIGEGSQEGMTKDQVLGGLILIYGNYLAQGQQVPNFPEQMLTAFDQGWKEGLSFEELHKAIYETIRFSRTNAKIFRQKMEQIWHLTKQIQDEMASEALGATLKDKPGVKYVIGVAGFNHGDGIIPVVQNYTRAEVRETVFNKPAYRSIFNDFFRNASEMLKFFSRFSPISPATELWGGRLRQATSRFLSLKPINWIFGMITTGTYSTPLAVIISILRFGREGSHPIASAISVGMVERVAPVSRTIRMIRSAFEPLSQTGRTITFALLSIRSGIRTVLERDGIAFRKFLPRVDDQDKTFSANGFFEDHIPVGIVSQEAARQGRRSRGVNLVHMNHKPLRSSSESIANFGNALRFGAHNGHNDTIRPRPNQTLSARRGQMISIRPARAEVREKTVKREALSVKRKEVDSSLFTRDASHTARAEVRSQEFQEIQSTIKRLRASFEKVLAYPPIRDGLSHELSFDLQRVVEKLDPISKLEKGLDEIKLREALQHLRELTILINRALKEKRIPWDVPNADGSITIMYERVIYFDLVEVRRRIAALHPVVLVEDTQQSVDDLRSYLETFPSVPSEMGRILDDLKKALMSKRTQDALQALDQFVTLGVPDPMAISVAYWSAGLKTYYRYGAHGSDFFHRILAMDEAFRKVWESLKELKKELDVKYGPGSIVSRDFDQRIVLPFYNGNWDGLKQDTDNFLVTHQKLEEFRPGFLREQTFLPLKDLLRRAEVRKNSLAEKQVQMSNHIAGHVVQYFGGTAPSLIRAEVRKITLIDLDLFVRQIEAAVNHYEQQDPQKMDNMFIREMNSWFIRKSQELTNNLKNQLSQQTEREKALGVVGIIVPEKEKIGIQEDTLIAQSLRIIGESNISNVAVIGKPGSEVSQIATQVYNQGQHPIQGKEKLSVPGVDYPIPTIAFEKISNLPKLLGFSLDLESLEGLDPISAKLASDFAGMITAMATVQAAIILAGEKPQEYNREETNSEAVLLKRGDQIWVNQNELLKRIVKALKLDQGIVNMIKPNSDQAGGFGFTIVASGLAELMRQSRSEARIQIAA